MIMSSIFLECHYDKVAEHHCSNLRWYSQLPLYEILTLFYDAKFLAFFGSQFGVESCIDASLFSISWASFTETTVWAIVEIAHTTIVTIVRWCTVLFLWIDFMNFTPKNIFINYWSLVLSNLTQKHDRPRLSDGSSPILTTVGETTGEKYEQCFFDHFYFDRFSRMTPSYESSSCLVLLPPPPPVASSNLSVLTILKFSWKPCHWTDFNPQFFRKKVYFHQKITNFSK